MQINGTERNRTLLFKTMITLCNIILKANTVKAKIKITLKNKILICLIGELILMIRLDLKKLIY